MMIAGGTPGSPNNVERVSFEVGGHMNSKLHRTSIVRLIAVFAVLMIIVAACGDSDSAETAANFDEIGAAIGGENAPTTAAAAATTAAPAAAGDGAEEPRDVAVAETDALGDGAIEVLQPADFGRDIIYTADLTIAVTDVAAAGEEAARVISSFGGILFGQRTEGLPDPRSVLTFKVLPEDFQDALAALGSIGEVRTQNVSADDVTDRIVDLESRILTAETSVERLRGFLENATTIEDIAQLENQLVKRETTLEQMYGQRRTLKDAVALATITVRLTEAFANPSLRLLASAYSGEDAGLSCPGNDNVTVEEGDPVNLCFEIRNNGDTTLTGFTLVDTVLVLSIDDLTVIDGDPAGDLLPGQSMILSTSVDVERRIRTQTTVTAIPVNADGTEIETRKVSDIGSVVLRSEKPEGLPGFDDGLRVATDVLQWIGGMFVIAAGLAVPFLWLIPLLALLWWWRRRRRDQRVEEIAAMFPTAPGDMAEGIDGTEADEGIAAAGEDDVPTEEAADAAPTDDTNGPNQEA